MKVLLIALSLVFTQGCIEKTEAKEQKSSIKVKNLDICLQSSLKFMIDDDRNVCWVKNTVTKQLMSVQCFVAKQCKRDSELRGTVVSLSDANICTEDVVFKRDLVKDVCWVKNEQSLSMMIVPCYAIERCEEVMETTDVTDTTTSDINTID